MKAAYSQLLVGGSLRINLNKWLLIMGKFRFNFQKREKALLETTNEGMQNIMRQEGGGGERSRREMSWAWGWWSEVLNHLSVSAEWKSRSGRWDAESSNVKILSSVVRTLSSTTYFLSFLSLHPRLPLCLLWCLFLLLLPANSKWLSLFNHSHGLSLLPQRDSFLFLLDCLLHENDDDLRKLHLLLFFLTENIMENIMRGFCTKVKQKDQNWK